MARLVFVQAGLRLTLTNPAARLPAAVTAAIVDAHSGGAVAGGEPRTLLAVPAGSTPFGDGYLAVALLGPLASAWAMC